MVGPYLLLVACVVATASVALAEPSPKTRTIEFPPLFTPIDSTAENFIPANDKVRDCIDFGAPFSNLHIGRSLEKCRHFDTADLALHSVARVAYDLNVTG